MDTDQAMILAILTVTVGMFRWGRRRHDMVAMGALALLMQVAIQVASRQSLPPGRGKRCWRRA